MRGEAEVRGGSKALFVEDLPDGSTLVECSECHQDIVDNFFGIPLHCLNCGLELFYPEGVDW